MYPVICADQGKVLTFVAKSEVDYPIPPPFACVKGNGPRSFSFAIKTTQTDSAGIISTGNHAINEGFTVGIGFGSEDSKTAGVIGVGGYSADYNPTVNPVNDGEWHTVLVTWNGKTLKTYIDNVLTLLIHDNSFHDKSVAKSTIKYDTQKDINYIGRYNDPDTPSYFNGQLKDIALYDEEIFVTFSLDGSAPTYSEMLYNSLYMIAIGASFVLIAFVAVLCNRRPSDSKGEYTALVEKV